MDVGETRPRAGVSLAKSEAIGGPACQETRRSGWERVRYANL